MAITPNDLTNIINAHAQHWAEMFEHAACGCVAEPQCEKCLEYLSLKN